MKQKKIKGWIVMWLYQGDMFPLETFTERSYAQYSIKKWQQEKAPKFKYKIVPCEISYSLPVKSKKK